MEPTQKSRASLRRIFMVAATAAMFASPAGSFAQTPSGTTNCQVPPQQQSQNGQAANGQSANEDASSQSLSGSLADCNGVLKPPATGDQQLVEPAPKTGNMPVIRPGKSLEYPP
ncbi:hypothetical protein MUU53_00965 [Rhizobium lemnae]|uniref:Uncharacterized protein n=1 Tax=Rhizobium lemnae TaxID=1214924 RepID=A0ABV8EAD7_9HYPH|nr:hypothetical protein [Rhizobium lemnae]MCJ8506476.1 hypothetical protein [Rhizobium lemnae]